MSGQPPGGGDAATMFFGATGARVITPLRELGQTEEESQPRAFEFAGRTAAGNEGTRFIFDDGEAASPADGGNADQFYPFQLTTKADGATIVEASELDASLEGGPGAPDVLLRVDIEAFHVGADEPVDKNTRATVRLTIGKDPSSEDKAFDTAFWAIAAGLKLFNDAKNKPSDAKELKGDITGALGRRPVEVPGGLAQIAFEVVKHKEPAWWQRIFKFLESGVGKNLVSVLGFPAIANEAIKLVDDALNRLDGANPQVLFQGARMQLALSKRARDAYSAGSARVKVGVLNPGFVILARGRDFQTIANAQASFFPQYGKLVPNAVKTSDIPSGRYDDPFRNVTYAVLRIGMKEAALDPQFDYGQR